MRKANRIWFAFFASSNLNIKLLFKWHSYLCLLLFQLQYQNIMRGHFWNFPILQTGCKNAIICKLFFQYDHYSPEFLDLVCWTCLGSWYQTTNCLVKTGKSKGGNWLSHHTFYRKIHYKHQNLRWLQCASTNYYAIKIHEIYLILFLHNFILSS